MGFSISVIIPLYNAEKYIFKALESCLQFDEVKEVLVIDDAFPDKGVDIVSDFIKKDNRVKLLHHPGHRNLGAGASRNLGIKNATQDYIAFLDADDFYLPNRFENDKKIFYQYPDAEGCYNALEAYFYSNEAKERFNKNIASEITTVNKKANPTPENLLRGMVGLMGDFGYFHLDCLTIKREALLKNSLLFNEQLRIHQDTDFIFKLAYYCRLYPSWIEKPVAMRGVHDENRILDNFEESVHSKKEKQYQMWQSLYAWAKREKIQDEKVLNHFRQQKEYFKLMSLSAPEPFSLFKEILLCPFILKNDKYREMHRFHTRPLGERVSFGLLRIRNWFYK